MPKLAQQHEKCSSTGRSTVSPIRDGSYKLLALAALTLQNTALVLLTKYSYRSSAEHYLVSTVVVCAEVVKLLLSYVLLVVSDDWRVAVEALREIPSSANRLLVPSLLYVFQNNLLFKGVRLLNPTTYTVCSQSKILSSALFSVLLLNTRITSRQCLSLVLLVIGMILVNVGEQPEDSAEIQLLGRSDMYTGVLAVLTAALTSGLAGTYLEKMYKEVGATPIVRSVWYRNAQLACFSVLVGAWTTYLNDGDVLRRTGIFQGYDIVVVGIILLQAIGGLVVATVLRYAGNVLKSFAISLSICNCAIATQLFAYDAHLISLSTLLGIAFVIFATFLYST